MFTDVSIMRKGHPLGCNKWINTTPVMGDSTWSNIIGRYTDPNVTAVKANDTIPNLTREERNEWKT